MSQVITLEASELGYAPGSFPRTFMYQNVRYNYAHKCEDREGDLMYIEYHPTTDHNEIVRIFND